MRYDECFAYFEFSSDPCVGSRSYHYQLVVGLSAGTQFTACEKHRLQEEHPGVEKISYRTD